MKLIKCSNNRFFFNTQFSKNIGEIICLIKFLYQFQFIPDKNINIITF